MIGQYEDQLERCSIGYDICMFACPVFGELKSQTVAPSRLAMLVNLIRKGQVPVDAGVVETLYQCIDCRLCKAWCVYEDVDVPAFLHAARAHVIETHRDVGLPSFVTNIEANARATGSPHDPACERSAGEARDGLSNMMSESGEVLYFAGCTTRSFHPEIAVAAMRILRGLGVSCVFRPDREGCCGSPYESLGFARLGREASEAMVRYVQDAGCETVVTACPRCAHAISGAFRRLEIGQAPRVLHASSFLADLIKAGGNVFKTGAVRRATYDDDPFMARYLGLLDPPRQVLAAIPGIELAEAVPNGRFARPSTCYFGLPDPSVARGVISRRVDELTRTKADLIITSSPFCKHDILSVVSDDVEVKDLVEVVSTAIG